MGSRGRGRGSREGEPRVESRTVVDAACVDRRIKLGGGVGGGLVEVEEIVGKCFNLF